MFLYSSIESDGQLQMVTTGSVTSTMAGINYVGSSILVESTTTAGTDVFINGLRVSNTGALRIVNGAGSNYSQGYSVDADGRLAVNTGAVGAGTWNNGVKIDANGRAYADVT
jgi:hypothetical protein